MKTLLPLTEKELHDLNDMIDRLDTEITLEDRTVSDIRLSIRECQYQRSFGRYCKKELNSL